MLKDHAYQKDVKCFIHVTNYYLARIIYRGKLPLAFTGAYCLPMTKATRLIKTPIHGGALNIITYRTKAKAEAPCLAMETTTNLHESMVPKNIACLSCLKIRIIYWQQPKRRERKYIYILMKDLDKKNWAYILSKKLISCPLLECHLMIRTC